MDGIINAASDALATKCGSALSPDNDHRMVTDGSNQMP